MKTYNKPELFYENFELSQHIAGTCQFKVTSTLNDEPNTCSGSGKLPFIDGIIVNGFARADVDCAVPVDIYCYQASESLVGLTYGS